MLPRELGHQPDATDRELRLERSGFVIQAGVKYAAVMSTLMSSEAGFFFADDDIDIGIQPLETVGCAEAYEAATDDEDFQVCRNCSRSANDGKESILLRQ
jgi:hypothetical protein